MRTPLTVAAGCGAPGRNRDAPRRRYYPLPDDEVEDFKRNLTGLGEDPAQTSFVLKVAGKDAEDWLWITPGCPVGIESGDEIPD